MYKMTGMSTDSMYVSIVVIITYMQGSGEYDRKTASDAKVLKSMVSSVKSCYAGPQLVIQKGSGLFLPQPQTPLGYIYK